jgi:murein L,D-transpeptidase YafK
MAFTRSVAFTILGVAIAFPAIGDSPEPVSWLDMRRLDQPLASSIHAWKKRTNRKTFAKKIVVYKESRRLDVYADAEVLKSYVVNLGGDPASAKRRQGDSATPEGELFVCAKNRRSQFHRFLALAYPTPADAERGVKEKLASAAELEATRAAYRERSGCPPQGTRLGGAVGIHGSGGFQIEGERAVIVDWTLGCVAVRDRDIDELFDDYAEIGTPVLIYAREPTATR